MEVGCEHWNLHPPWSRYCVKLELEEEPAEERERMEEEREAQLERRNKLQRVVVPM